MCVGLLPTSTCTTTHPSFLVHDGKGNNNIVVVVAGLGTCDAGTKGMPGATSLPSDGTDFSSATWAALALRYEGSMITSARSSIATCDGILTLNSANFGRPNCGGPFFAASVDLAHSELLLVMLRGVNELCSSHSHSHSHRRSQCRVPLLIQCPNTYRCWCLKGEHAQAPSHMPHKGVGVVQ